MGRKTILVTGATSPIISGLIDFILENGYNVIGITRNLRNARNEKIRWIKCDLTEKNADYSFMKNVDLIIHAAAVSNSYIAHEYLNVNLNATINLIKNARAYNVKEFVYISSILSCKDCGAYGSSKFRSENYIRSSFDNWLIIRPSQVFGGYGSNPIDSLISKINRRKVILCPAGDNENLYPIFYKELVSIIYEIVFIKKYLKSVQYIVGPEVFNYTGLVKVMSKSLNRHVYLLSVPKFIMMLIKELIIFTGLKIGIYPDQIHRLYLDKFHINNKNVHKGSISFKKYFDYIYEMR